MPEINGYELCSRLKKIPGFLNVPVILLASLRGPEDLTQILKSGADGFIYKEFDPNYFIPMLSSILMSHSSDSRDNRSFELKFSESNISLSSLALKNILMCSFGTAVYCREKLESSKIKT
jgi:DNA-binding response OmpR family regulator